MQDHRAIAATVIVPTVGRPNELRRCLESLVRCRPSANEILVVDQSHQESVREVVADFASGGARLVPCDGSGAGRARNLGLREATNELVLMTDDDCVVDKDWVAAGARHLAGHPGAIVTGRVLAGGSSDVVPSIVDDPVSRDFTGELHFGMLFTNNMAAVKSELLGFGAFDERMVPAAEDNDLCYRWLRAGRALRYEPDLLVWHHAAHGQRGLRRLYAGYGRGLGRFYAKYMARGDMTVLSSLTAVGLALRALVLPSRGRRRPSRIHHASLLRGLIQGLFEGRRLFRHERRLRGSRDARLIVAGLVARVMRLSRRQAAAVLVYHGVAEAFEDPERTILPSVEREVLARQLDHLRSIYRVVPPSRVLDAAASRRRGERFPVALTFDDDLASHRSVAMPVLQAAELPAGFFVNGATLDVASTFWWEKLQRLIDMHGPHPSSWPASVRELAPAAIERPDANVQLIAQAIEDMDNPRRDELVAAISAHLPPEPRDAGLRPDDLRELARARFEIGFHTIRHERLVSLEDAALERSLVDGRAGVEEAVGRNIAMIAYPHGVADARVADAARAAGYRLGFTGEPAPVRPDTDPLLVGRIVAPAASVTELGWVLVRALRPRRQR